MDSFPNASYADRSVLLDNGSTLVMADLHLGRVRESDVELPLGEAEDILTRLETRLSEAEPDRVVVAGDIVHAFGTVPYGVSETVRSVAEMVRKAGAELIVTEGNHDSALESVDSIDPIESSRLDEETLVYHGHQLPTETASRYIIGHDHPAIKIEGTRRPCFLICPDQHDGATVMVVPAFSRVAVGTLVNGRTATDTLSPLLTDLDQCRPVVPTDKGPLPFPPLASLETYL